MTTPPYEAPNIFVSHSHEDNDFVNKLVQDLQELLGIGAIWHDIKGGLRGGDSWWSKIREELTARPVFIVVLSPNAVKSNWVNDEIDMAWRQKNSKMGKRIIPILYQQCEVRNDLKNIHNVSFLPPKAYEAAFNELLKALDLPMILEAKSTKDQLSQKTLHTNLQALQTSIPPTSVNLA